MTRIQFWILTAGSGLVALLLLLQVLFSRSTQKAHADILGAEQVINVGRTNEAQLRQLAARIYQVSQQTQDQGLKDLLSRPANCHRAARRWVHPGANLLYTALNCFYEP